MKTADIARIVREGYEVSRLNDGINDLIDALDLDYLFVDTHPGVNEETLLSIAVSDTLLLILRPDNQDFQGISVTVELARRLEVPSMYMLLNKVPDNVNRVSLRESVESAYGAPVAGVFPLNIEMVRMAGDGIFYLRFPEHPYSREIELVAQQLMASK